MMMKIGGNVCSATEKLQSIFPENQARQGLCIGGTQFKNDFIFGVAFQARIEPKSRRGISLPKFEAKKMAKMPNAKTPEKKSTVFPFCEYFFRSARVG